MPEVITPLLEHLGTASFVDVVGIARVLQVTAAIEANSAYRDPQLVPTLAADSWRQRPGFVRLVCPAFPEGVSAPAEKVLAALNRGRECWIDRIVARSEHPRLDYEGAIGMMATSFPRFRSWLPYLQWDLLHSDFGSFCRFFFEELEGERAERPETLAELIGELLHRGSPAVQNATWVSLIESVGSYGQSCPLRIRPVIAPFEEEWKDFLRRFYNPEVHPLLGIS